MIIRDDLYIFLPNVVRNSREDGTGATVTAQYGEATLDITVAATDRPYAFVVHNAQAPTSVARCPGEDPVEFDNGESLVAADTGWAYEQATKQL